MTSQLPFTASTPVVKRKKCELTPDSQNTSDTIDEKKIKRILSISDTDSEISFIMSKEEKKQDLPNPNTSADTNPKETHVQALPGKSINVEDLFAKLDTRLQDKLVCMKNDIVSDIKDSFGKAIGILDSKVLQLELENDQLKKDMKLLKSTTEKAIADVKTMNKTILDLQEKTVRNEQYSRKQNIRITGLAEPQRLTQGEKDDAWVEPEENVVNTVENFISGVLGLEVNTCKENAIEIAHRLGDEASKTKGVNGARPIIVRLGSVTTKLAILKARRNLKGKGIYITEDLCRDIHALFNRVRKHRNIDQAWTWNGTVYGKDFDDNVYKFPYGKEVGEVIKK